jgi:1-acyl-sn-glycerol-3-phosphate acyltransferase
MARQLAVPFAGKRVVAGNAVTWLRLTAAGAVLFGPARASLIRAGNSGDRRRLHTRERAWARSATSALGMRIEQHGLHHIDESERYVVAPLHEGFADALCLVGLPLDLTFAARDELFDWTSLGPYLTASGQANIPTHDGAAAYRAMYRAAERAFSEGESFVVFPQGSILGIEAGFQPGAFRIAERLNRPVLPVVISGTHRVWEHPYQPTVRTAVRVFVDVLEPVAPDRIAAEGRSLEREMKRRALASAAPPRRFDPDRDGWWDDYPYEIDPDFTELADRVAAHRSVISNP